MPPRTISRRGLLALAAGTVGAVGAAAGCAPPTPTPAPKLAEQKPTAAPTLAPAATKPAAGAPQATPAAAAPGTAGPTLKMAFVPSANSQKILSSGQPLGDLLARLTGYRFEVDVPTSYAAVIEAMGAGKTDVGWLAPFAYVLAHDKYGAEVMLMVMRDGTKSYVSQFIAHADSNIKTIEDLKGKKFAFGDAASASNYLYPAAYLKEKGYDPKTFFSEVFFAGGHDKVVLAVYGKTVDGGATYGRSNPDPSRPLRDARLLVRSAQPDVVDKVKIIAETDTIPNDTVSVRKAMDQAVVDKVKTALLQAAKMDEGKKYLTDLYDIDGFADAVDSDFDPIRRKAQLVGVSIEQAVIPPAKPQATATAPVGAATKPAGTPPSKP
ncbi:MAG TPA: phosphate/phosphite/phosphonate ABC transporter substrate-binding protein [Chloroflexota bacterium]|jgi:phosphonate transport system substrate-binding protein|nr:phosphate/phosphite/phosphonate ABC transporter substrate-binding protein [Chloroflexota bacterium]